MALKPGDVVRILSKDYNSKIHKDGIAKIVNSKGAIDGTNVFIVAVHVGGYGHWIQDKELELASPIAQVLYGT